MPNKSDIKLLFETCKARHEAAKKELREMLKLMVEYGMAKEVEDGYGGDYVMTIVADPSLLSQIDYYVYEGDEEPEFWNELAGGPVLGKVEWW